VRLALLTPDWQPNGGLATYIRLVSAALAAAGHHVLVLHADASDGDVPAGIETARVRGLTRSGHGPEVHAAAASAMEHLLAFRPDVVHFHGSNNIPLETAALAEFPAVKTFHVYDFCPSGTKFHHASDSACVFPTGVACLPRQAYLRCTLSKRPSVMWSQYQTATEANRHNKQFGRLTVASEFVKREAVRTGYDADRVDVVPYFTPLPAVTGASGLDAAPRSRHILFVGRLIREKGVDLLLDALETLKGDWTCTIVGDGIAGDKIRAAAGERKLNGRVTFAGWLNGAALSAAYASAAVVAVPSRWPEPFGIIGLEAFAHARPVVAFRVGGIPEWLDDDASGFLVEPNNARRFGERLSWLLDRPVEAAAMGARGRARVEKDFTAPAHLARMMPIYERILGRR
jgi:glycosyltransferase involved in cell wall biosynthesis